MLEGALWGWGCSAVAEGLPSVWSPEFEAQHRPLAHWPAPVAARAPAGGGSLQTLSWASAARESQSWAAGNGARLAAVLPHLGNFPWKAVRAGGLWWTPARGQLV